MSHYTLTSYTPLSWQLESSADGERWDVLVDDDTLGKCPQLQATWRVQQQPSASADGHWHRYFRILRTGLSAYRYRKDRLGLRGFELYGTLFTSPSAH